MSATGDFFHGHLKTDGLLARSGLKGELRDALHAVMCGAGNNLRLILAGLRALYCALIVVVDELIYSDALRGSDYRFGVDL